MLLVGAFAIYLEPWHADIFEFLDLRKNHGKVWLMILQDDLKFDQNGDFIQSYFLLFFFFFPSKLLCNLPANFLLHCEEYG